MTSAVRLIRAQGEVRQCLFCSQKPPANMDPLEMRGGRFNWYANGLSRPPSREIVWFFVCPGHLGRIPEAWEWVREGFIAEDIKDLRGIEAVDRFFALGGTRRMVGR